MPIDSGPTPTGTMGDGTPTGTMGDGTPTGTIGGETLTGTIGTLSDTVREPLEKEAKAGDCIVVYSVATGRVRRWYASNKTGEIKGVDIAQGEAVLHVDAERGLTLPILQARVTQATGKTPASDRYVLIDPDGKIVSSCIADQSCGDKAEHFGPGCALVQHDTADERWTYNAAQGTFTPPADTLTEEQKAARIAAKEKAIEGRR